MKNRWLAGALNLIPGIGYLYVGTRTVFGTMLLLVWPLSIVGAMANPIAAEATASTPMSAWDTAVIFVIVAAFVVDAYLEATKQNVSFAKAKRKK